MLLRGASTRAQAAGGVLCVWWERAERAGRGAQAARDVPRSVAIVCVHLLWGMLSAAKCSRLSAVPWAPCVGGCLGLCSLAVRAPRDIVLCML